MLAEALLDDLLQVAFYWKHTTSDWLPAKPYKESNSQDLMTQADIIIIISSSNDVANPAASALTFALCSANTDGCL